MKKTCIIGLLAGVCGLANATTIDAPSSIVSPNTLSGNNAYEWGINLGSGVQVATAEVYINATLNHSGNSAGTGKLWVDLLNSSNTGIHSPSDSDKTGDYWTTLSAYRGANSGNLKSLGSLYFAAVNVTKTLDFVMSATQNSSALADLNAYLTANNGVFDIGFDPDCTFTLNAMSFKYTTAPKVTVPDTATTVLLLGAGLLGLEVLRRKFVPVKIKA